MNCVSSPRPMSENSVELFSDITHELVATPLHGAARSYTLEILEMEWLDTALRTSAVASLRCGFSLKRRAPGRAGVADVMRGGLLSLQLTEKQRSTTGKDFLQLHRV